MSERCEHHHEMHGHRLYDRLLCGTLETLETCATNVIGRIPEGMLHHLQWSLAACRPTHLWVMNMPLTAATYLHPILARVQSATTTGHDRHHLCHRPRRMARL
jgi:hypothetical protein